jgi:hypothetical protein
MYLKKYRPLSFLLLLGLLGSAFSAHGKGCDTQVLRNLYWYSFINPSIIDPYAAGAPLVLGFENLYDRYGRQSTNQVEDNILEWRSRYCDVPTADDIRYIVYQAPVYELEDLLNAMDIEGPGMSSYIRQNSFSRYLYRNKCEETIEYLLYTRSCEPYVTPRDDWNEKQLNLSVVNDLIERGRRAFMQTKSHYIRLRYAYQMIRLAHYTRQYERTIQLYDYLMPKVDNDPSIIEYWIIGHRAGALLALGKNVAAAYDYARVFLHCPSKRESALQSFKISTDEEWHQCMLLCKDDRERATLYAMRAFQRDSRALEEMQSIYDLNPKSEYLEVLLVREMRKLEKQLLGLEWNPKRAANKRFFKIPQPDAGDYLIKLQEFTERLYKEGQVRTPDLWLLAFGYEEMIAGDFYAAKKTFTRARDLLTDKTLLDQLTVFELAAQIGVIREINIDTETDLANIMYDSRVYRGHPGFPNFLRDKLGWLYQKSGNPGKYFLVQHTLDDLYVNPQEGLLLDLIALLQKKSLNRLEISLLKEQETTTSAEDLIAIRATMLLDHQQLDSATTEFKRIGRTRWDNYGQFDPFIERLNDCVNCVIRDDSSNLLNRGEVMEKLSDLEYKAIANQQIGAAYFYKIGLAYYNMSYFSYAWPLMDNFRSGASLLRRKDINDPNLIPDPRFALGNREHFDCSKAMNYFDLARRLALDPELAAKATFMAAKCEQNAYFVRRTGRTYAYFDLLKTQYANTQFYLRAIRECKYFSAYAAK